MLFQQITGQPSVLYYAAKIFKDAGFASDATKVSAVLGAFKLVATGELLILLCSLRSTTPLASNKWTVSVQSQFTVMARQRINRSDDVPQTPLHACPCVPTCPML